MNSPAHSTKFPLSVAIEIFAKHKQLPCLKEYNYQGMEILFKWLGEIEQPVKQDKAIPWYQAGYYVHRLADLIGCDPADLYHTIIKQYEIPSDNSNDSVCRTCPVFLNL